MNLMPSVQRLLRHPQDFKPPPARSHAVAAGPVPAGEAAGCGWFDSSHALSAGLAVFELEVSDDSGLVPPDLAPPRAEPVVADRIEREWLRQWLAQQTR